MMIDAVVSPCSTTPHNPHRQGVFYPLNFQLPQLHRSPLLRPKKQLPESTSNGLPKYEEIHLTSQSGKPASPPPEYRRSSLAESLSSSSSSSSPPALQAATPWRSPTVQKKLAFQSNNQHQAPSSRSSPFSLSSSSQPSVLSSPLRSASPSQVFSERLESMFQSFALCNQSEQVMTVWALAKRMRKRHIKFLNRTFSQLLASDSFVADDDDSDESSRRNRDDDDNDDTDDDKMEEEANDSEFVRSLSNEPKERAISTLLSHFPLLKPGNTQAKQEYLKLIPRIVKFPAIGSRCEDNVDGSVSSKATQLLTYLYIHPALSQSEYKDFVFWLNGVDPVLRTERGRDQDKCDKLPSQTAATNQDDQHGCIGEKQAGNKKNFDSEVTDAGEKNNEKPQKEIRLRRQPTARAPSNSLSSKGLVESQDEYESEAYDQVNENSERLSQMLFRFSRDSGVSISSQNQYQMEQESPVSKRSLAPSMSVPISRELNLAPERNDMTFAEEMTSVGKNRFSQPTFGPQFCAPAKQLEPWQYAESSVKNVSFNLQANDGKNEGHSKLARTQSLAPGWLNRGQLSEGLHNPAFRMRCILGPHSNHLPLSPQSSSNSTDSNESQADVRFLAETSDWSATLSIWLKSLRLHKYTSILQSLSYEELMNLTEEWLIQKDVTKGARDKLLLNIKNLRDRPNVLDALEKELKTNPETLQNVISELDKIVKTPMKRSGPEESSSTHGFSKDYSNNALSSNRQCLESNGENLTERIVSLLEEICSLLLAFKQHQSDIYLCSSFLRLVKACSVSPSFVDDQKKRFTSLEYQVKKMQKSHDKSRFLAFRNFGRGQGQGYAKPSFSHQPLARRSTAAPGGGGGSYDLMGLSNQYQEHQLYQQDQQQKQQNQQHEMSLSSYAQGYPNCCPSAGASSKIKMPIGRTHSAPLNSDIGPSLLASKKSQFATATEETAESLLALDPSMEKHALGGVLLDLS